MVRASTSLDLAGFGAGSRERRHPVAPPSNFSELMERLANVLVECAFIPPEVHGRQSAEGRLGSRRKYATDIEGSVDQESEPLIVRVLRGAFPGCRIVAEELDHGQVQVTMDTDWGDLRFVIDPVDGTKNWRDWVRKFGPSIAVDLNGLAIGGIVLNMGALPNQVEFWLVLRELTGENAGFLEPPVTHVWNVGARIEPHNGQFGARSREPFQERTFSGDVHALKTAVIGQVLPELATMRCRHQFTRAFDLWEVIDAGGWQDPQPWSVAGAVEHVSSRASLIFPAEPVGPVSRSDLGEFTYLIETGGSFPHSNGLSEQIRRAFATAFGGGRSEGASAFELTCGVDHVGVYNGIRQWDIHAGVQVRMLFQDVAVFVRKSDVPWFVPIDPLYYPDLDKDDEVFVVTAPRGCLDLVLAVIQEATGGVISVDESMRRPLSERDVVSSEVLSGLQLDHDGHGSIVDQ